MPAIVLVGAQWGDEGKGKATDLLGSSVDYVVKFNGGNNAGHTIVGRTARSTPCTCCPAASSAPAAPRSSATASSSTSAVLFQEIDALEARGVDTSRLVGQRQRPPHPAVQPRARQGDRALPGLAPDRHHRARHRPHLRRQDEPGRHPRAGPVRRVDPAPEGRGGARRSRTRCSPRSTTAAPSRCRRSWTSCSTYAERLRPMVVDTGLLLVARRWTRARPCCSRRPGHAAGRRPRHLPVRDVLERDRRRRLHRLRHPADPGRPGHRDPQGLHDPGRRGAVPDRAARRHGRVPAQDRRRVRHDDRAAAPLRLAGHRRSAATPPASTASPTSSSPSSTC